MEYGSTKYLVWENALWEKKWIKMGRDISKRIQIQENHKHISLYKPNLQAN